jgi:DNA-binding transcriptional LysR family regulator
LDLLLAEGFLMRVPQISIDMMVAVTALARTKSLERAAKELGLTSSAVHKRIKAANRLFGDPLFEMKRAGVELTEAGEIFCLRATRAIEEVLLAEEATKAAFRLKSNRLIVGHSTYLPPSLLAMIHDSSFVDRLPIRLEHKAGLTPTLIRDVYQGTIHAGLGFLPIAHHDLLAYELSQEPLVVCMPRNHPLAVRAVLRPQDLAGEPFIATGRENFPALHHQIDEYFLSLGVSLSIVAEAFGPSEAVAMVEQRVGICLVPGYHAKIPVVTRPLSPQILFRRCCLFVREDNRHPALKSFVDLILAKTKPRRIAK